MQILLADNHTLFRESLAYVLKDLEKKISVIHTTTATEAIAASYYYKYFHLVLLGQSVVNGDSSIIATINKATDKSPVVILSSSSHDEDIQRALQAGAASYFPKSIGTQELIYGLKRILGGAPYMPASLLERITDNCTPLASNSVGYESLTVRQKGVLQLLSKGLSNKSIARELEISEGTVKLHVSAIIHALGVRNRTEAAVAARQLQYS